MNRFDRYLLREALPPLLFSLALYGSLAVLSMTLPRLQWIIGTPFVQLSLWLILQVPLALVQTFPITLVLAVLLVFGRLASSNELLAAQAGGISLLRIALAFVLLSGVLAGASLAFNQWVLPVTNAKVISLYWQLTSGNSGLWRLAAKEIPLEGYTLRFEKADPDTDELLDVRLESWQDKTLTVLFAERAAFTDGGLRLYNYQVNVTDFAALRLNLQSSNEVLQSFLLSDNAATNAEQSFLLTTSNTVETLVERFSSGGFEDSRSISEVYRDANDLEISSQERRFAAVLFHRKLVEPLANFTLLLVAIPLSLLYARSRSVAFGLSLIVTLLWYLFLTMGQLFAQTGTVPVWLGMWSGNIILATIGSYLLLARTRLR